MKTLLINPDKPKSAIERYLKEYPKIIPMGLAYIAATLEGKHEIIILDNNLEEFSDEKIIEFLKQNKPKIVGITAMSVMFERAIEIAKLVKKTDPAAITVIGGSHANSLPEAPLAHSCIDYVVHGEGENVVGELWEKLEKKQSIENIKGIAFRKNGRIIVNPRPDLIKDLNSLPFPARHLFPMERYERRELGLGVYPVDNVNTSRGCPYRCRFCSAKAILGAGYRLRDAKNVLDEIELMIKEYGSKGIYFREDNFTASRRRVIEICNEIKRRNLKFLWACESRVNSVDEELLKIMREAGCRMIWFGAEAGTQKTLDLIQKDITLEEVKIAFKAAKKARIKTGASFIIGFPHETMEDIEQTIKFADEVDPDSAWFNIFWVIPVSEMYYEVKEKKLIDESLGSEVFTVKTNWFDRKKMEEIQAYATRKFYGKPKRLIRKALEK